MPVFKFNDKFLKHIEKKYKDKPDSELQELTSSMENNLDEYSDSCSDETVDITESSTVSSEQDDDDDSDYKSSEETISSSSSSSSEEEICLCLEKCVCECVCVKTRKHTKCDCVCSCLKKCNCVFEDVSDCDCEGECDCSIENMCDCEGECTGDCECKCEGECECKYKNEYEDLLKESIMDNLKDNLPMYLKRIANSKFDEYVKKIEDKVIDIDNILINEDIQEKHKMKLVEKYLCMMTVEEFTEEYYVYRNDMGEYYKKVTLSHNEEYNENKNMIKDQMKNKSTSLKEQIVNLDTNLENKTVIYDKLRQMNTYPSNDSDYHKLKAWVNFSLSLPYNNIKKLVYDDQTLFMRGVKLKLDQEIYGLDNVKEQLLILLNARLNNNMMVGCSIGFIGVPGVGKTRLAHTLAEILDYPFRQISFGGVNSSSFLKGHEMAYIGSQPGEIVKSLKQLKYKNGILFLDELDKITDNKEIVSSLLHITDFQQNHSFNDLYLDGLNIDLSSIWWIYSMNEKPKDKAFQDRLFLVEMKGYNLKDKEEIVCNYSLPRICRNLGLDSNDITIDRNCVPLMTEESEKGMRSIESVLKEVCNKVFFLYKHNDIECSFKLKENVSLPYHITNESFNILHKKEAHINNFMYI